LAAGSHAHPARLQDLSDEIFISVSNTAPVLRIVIDEHLQKTRADIHPQYEMDNLAMAMSLIASTRGVALLPLYAKNFSFLVCEMRRSKKLIER
jgi:LysR family hca operon transcriptional activator